MLCGAVGATGNTENEEGKTVAPQNPSQKVTEYIPVFTKKKLLDYFLPRLHVSHPWLFVIVMLRADFTNRPVICMGQIWDAEDLYPV